MDDRKVRLVGVYNAGNDNRDTTTFPFPKPTGNFHNAFSTYTSYMAIPYNPPLHPANTTMRPNIVLGDLNLYGLPTFVLKMAWRS